MQNQLRRYKRVEVLTLMFCHFNGKNCLTFISSGLNSEVEAMAVALRPVELQVGASKVSDVRAFKFYIERGNHVILEVLITTDDSQQSQWRLCDLVTALWPGVSKVMRSRIFKWDTHHEAMEDMHRAMWPGIVIPPKWYLSMADGKFVAKHAYVSTSVVVSGVLTLFQTTRRSIEARVKAYQFLVAMVNSVAKTGDWFLTVNHVAVDGSVTSHSFTVGMDGRVSLDDFWDIGFFRAYLANQWSLDLNDAKKPWVSTPSSLQHIADIVAFVLDVPQLGGNARNRLRADAWDVVLAKGEYRGCVLEMMTYLALQLETKVGTTASEPMMAVMRKRATHSHSKGTIGQNISNGVVSLF